MFSLLVWNIIHGFLKVYLNWHMATVKKKVVELCLFNYKFKNLKQHFLKLKIYLKTCHTNYWHDVKIYIKNLSILIQDECSVAICSPETLDAGSNNWMDPPFLLYLYFTLNNLFLVPICTLWPLWAKLCCWPLFSDHQSSK